MRTTYSIRRLKPSRLPLANDYVRKIQATYALDRLDNA